MECLDQHRDLRNGLVRILDSPHEVEDMSRTFGCDQAELGQVASERIDDLGSLLHQEVTGPEHESGGLGLLALGVNGR
jgi:hypothetical protein